MLGTRDDSLLPYQSTRRMSQAPTQSLEALKNEKPEHWWPTVLEL